MLNFQDQQLADTVPLWFMSSNNFPFVLVLYKYYYNNLFQMSEGGGMFWVKEESSDAQKAPFSVNMLRI